MRIMARLMMSAAGALQRCVDGGALGEGSPRRVLVVDARQVAAAAEQGFDIALLRANFLVRSM
jgi:hypothetical protein